MHPVINENVMSVVIAVVASFAFGWIWHGPLFGKLWMKLMGLKNMKPNTKLMIQSMVIGIIGTILTAHVLVFTTNVWRPSVWGIGTDQQWCTYGFYSGFFTWLGFYVPMLLNSVAWENRSWKLFCFYAVYHFINLQIIAMIVSYMYA